jgi:hypothetical protein
MGHFPLFIHYRLHGLLCGIKVSPSLLLDCPKYLLNKLTITEHQIASRIATKIDQSSKDFVDNALVSAQLNKNSKWINNLIIHYTHEQRLEGLKKILINYGIKHLQKHQ